MCDLPACAPGSARPLQHVHVHLTDVRTNVAPLQSKERGFGPSSRLRGSRRCVVLVLSPCCVLGECLAACDSATPGAAGADCGADIGPLSVRLPARRAPRRVPARPGTPPSSDARLTASRSWLTLRLRRRPPRSRPRRRRRSRRGATTAAAGPSRSGAQDGEHLESPQPDLSRTLSRQKNHSCRVISSLSCAAVPDRLSIRAGATL